MVGNRRIFFSFHFLNPSRPYQRSRLGESMRNQARERLISLRYFLDHSRWGPPIRRTFVGLTGFTSIYYLDAEWNAKTFQRNLRTLWTGICLTADYKLSFREGNDVEAVHKRNAERILDVCQRNGYVDF